MATMLDVISRTEEKMNFILEHKEEIFKETDRIVKEVQPRNMILVGSGSSYSSALSAMSFIEKSSGLNTSVFYPNIFLEKKALSKDTLYVFVSQSGTSSLTLLAAKKMNELGMNTLALCGDKDSPIGKACRYFIEIAVGYEEYTYATLGYSLSLFTEMLLGMEIGRINNVLSKEEYDEYLKEAKCASGNNHENIQRTIKWFNEKKDNLLNKQNFVIYGGKSLYGIANEGCLKIMEISKRYISVAYELDDGLHGPNYCIDERAAVIVLSDGKDSEKVTSLMNLMKKEYGCGYVAGKDVMDKEDALLLVECENFANLELVSFVQTLAYLLAKENNVDIFERNDPRLQKTKGKGYFNMHDVSKI